MQPHLGGCASLFVARLWITEVPARRVDGARVYAEYGNAGVDGQVDAYLASGALPAEG